MNTHTKIKRLITSALFTVLTFYVAFSSSHREAPLISNDPLADNVDLYAFRSPDNPDMVSIIATYVPFQLPHGGPNYYTFGENVRYEIHVDNNPDIVGDELTYRFTFNIINEDPTTFFNIRLGKENQKATYNLERSTDGGKTFQMIIENGIVPPNNIGPRSIEGGAGLSSNYETLWQNSIQTSSTGERIFVGPSDDPFFVDLGGIFDLGDAPRQEGIPSDGVACFNVSTIAIQVPISTLLREDANSTPSSILDPNYVIGVWASASRPAIRTLSPNAGPSYEGDWIQVSRLGMPLTNEAVIPVGDKDFWNSITPYDEWVEATLDEHFYNPELALYMDDDLFGGAVPAFSNLRIQTNSLGAFDFSNGADGLFALKGSDAVAGTALDDNVFGNLLLPAPGKPRSVDLWPVFHTGVPNVAPYQLATGKDGNPLAIGKPFIHNFLPNGGDMLRLNMAVPPTSRDDMNFNSLGLIQAAVLGLTTAPYNSNADLEFIPNMDGFPNGRRLEDDVTRIELQAVSGAVLAAVGLWYDDYDPQTSSSPVTQDLLDVLTYSTGVESNDRAFRNEFPYVALPFSGTGDCSGVFNQNGMTETVATFYTSSNTSGEIGVYNIQDDESIVMESLLSEAGDADGIYYDSTSDVIYQLNRSDNVINAYSNVSTDPALTATSTSDFSNGREIAVAGNKLIVAQDESDNNDGNKLIIYNISPTSITLDKVYEVDINLWGIHIDGNRLFAIVDNSSDLAIFDNFFSNTEGPIVETRRIGITDMVRTHGVTFDGDNGTLYLTDVGSGSVADDGAYVVVPNFEDASSDLIISEEEQFRIEGASTFLGNPVDIAFDPLTQNIFIAERANEGGRVLGFSSPTADGDQVPFYNKLAPGTSAIFFPGGKDSPFDCNVSGGMIATADGATELTICSDGEPDPFDVALTGSSGGISTWIITDESGNILGLPTGNTFDFDPIGVGVCLIYNLSYIGDVNLPSIGGNISDLSGCHELSNAITVTRLSGDDCFEQNYTGTLTGTQEVIPAVTMATGQVQANLTGSELVITGSFEGLIGDFDASIAGGAHIHMAPTGRAGGIVRSLTTSVSEDLRSGSFNADENTFTLTEEEIAALTNRGLYINIHTTAYPSGELRAQLLPENVEVFQTNLLGSNQSPQVVTNATGGVLFELTGNTITVSGSFSGLSSEIATDIAGGAHIHHAPAGRAGEVVRVLNLSMDSDMLGATIHPEENTFTLTDEELGWLNFNALYINVHSLNWTGGEIRGQMSPLAIASFRSKLTGIQQSPPIQTEAGGMVNVNYYGDNQITVFGSFDDLAGTLATEIAGGIHLHQNLAGRAGPVITPIVPVTSNGDKNGILFPADNVYNITDEETEALFNRSIYVNVHSATYESGEIRGQTLPMSQAFFATNLSGLNEVDVINSPASGNILLEWNQGKLIVSGGFQDLTGDFDETIAGGSHIHSASAGENGPIALNLSPTFDGNLKEGVFMASQNTFDLDDSQMMLVADGGAYVNIHTTTVPAGELRGQILSDCNLFPGKVDIVTPRDGSSITVNDSEPEDLFVSWEESEDMDDDKVVYTWQLLGDSDGSSVLLQVNNGTSTELRLNHDDLIDFLNAQNVLVGNDITLYHRVVSSDGSLNSFGPSAQIDIDRIDVLLEGCHTPQNFELSRLSSNRFSLKWDRVRDARAYELSISFTDSPQIEAIVRVRRNRVFVNSPSNRGIIVKVRAVCFGELSEFTNPETFTSKNIVTNFKNLALGDIIVTEFDPESELKTYPNPTTGEFFISFDATVSDLEFRAQIFDITGRVVATTPLRGDVKTQAMNISELQDGVYIVQITGGQVVLKTERIIKSSK